MGRMKETNVASLRHVVAALALLLAMVCLVGGESIFSLFAGRPPKKNFEKKRDYRRSHEDSRSGSYESYENYDCHHLPSRGTFDCDNPEATFRWYYSYRENKCYRFRYTGCGGSRNNFYSRRECRRECTHRGMRKYHGYRDDDYSDEYYNGRRKTYNGRRGDRRYDDYDSRGDSKEDRSYRY